MAQAAKKVNWKFYFSFSLTVLTIITVIAILTGLWVLTAIPVGFLFGFFLQKGALCGSSAFSEVLLMKDAQKVWGLWIAIVTGMGGFAILDLLGWITLNPKPFTWLSMIVGGVIFGVGIVLAGGCVSGSLFKAGIGHINSIVALLSIALGIAAVEAGPLAAMNKWMNGHVLSASNGGSITLSSLTGLPFWLLALIIIILTLIAGILFRRKKSDVNGASVGDKADFSRMLTNRRWRPWQAGLAIGILGSFAYLSSAASGRNYPLGVTHGVYHTQILITDHPVHHVYRPPTPKPMTQESDKTNSHQTSQKKPVLPIPRKKVNWWLIAGIISLVTGSWIAARLSGEAKLYNKSADQIIIAIIGGFLVGAGAGFAKGCVVGNIISGWALMSIGTIVFGITVVIANWITTYLYLMGGRLSDLQRK